MDKKRILIAVGFLLVCVGIGYLLYRIFFYKAPAEIMPKVVPEGTSQGEFPEAGTGQQTGTTGGNANLPQAQGGTTGGPTTEIKITPREKQVVKDPIVSPTKNTVNGSKFYNQTDGKFYNLDANGNLRSLSDKTFYNVQQVDWSPIKNEAIMEYPDYSKIYYNFDTGKQVTLPKHWENFSFSPIGDKVAVKSYGLSPENRWLITSDPDGKNISQIEPMGLNGDKVNVDWSPNKQIIATSLTGEELGDDRQEVLFVGLNHENFKSTIIEGRDFRSIWSPLGKRILYSVHSARNDYKPELWIVDAESQTIGQNRQIVGLNTWADKCTFKDERFAYCAVPQTLDGGEGFAPGLADNTPDNIFQIDMLSGIKTQLKVNDEYTINSMFVSADGKTLFYTDKHKDGLFSLPL